MSNQIPQIKIVLLGDESVGKTSLLRKWTSKVYDPNSSPTIGGAAQVKRDEVDGQQYTFQIWDTAGAERYRALAPLYARDSYAAMIVFDMTRKKTFDDLNEWVNFLQAHGDIPFIIVGNKTDLVDNIEINIESGVEYATSVGSQFYDTSAKAGANVDLAFKQLEMTAVKYFLRKIPTNQALMNINDRETKQSKQCC